MKQRVFLYAVPRFVGQEVECKERNMSEKRMKRYIPNGGLGESSSGAASFVSVREPNGSSWSAPRSTAAGGVGNR